MLDGKKTYLGIATMVAGALVKLLAEYLRGKNVVLDPAGESALIELVAQLIILAGAGLTGIGAAHKAEKIESRLGPKRY